MLSKYYEGLSTEIIHIVKIRLNISIISKSTPSINKSVNGYSLYMRIPAAVKGKNEVIRDTIHI